ncbi:hypothetical protein CEXT_215591 [Caerostris extrusa]|uniref:Ig-like domain-containing protein n=1 Tax=Caerostris extrusa TaxID=172846 RepID=A0AAV4XFP5_CAEEX|nr:hypothetical protein CEXT_215591 [Caerostris extrusa]
MVKFKCGCTGICDKSCPGLPNKVPIPEKIAKIPDIFIFSLSLNRFTILTKKELTLAILTKKGDPSPAVRWLRNAELLDDSYYITLKDSPVTNCYYPVSREPTSCPVSPVRCPTQTCPHPSPAPEAYRCSHHHFTCRDISVRQPFEIVCVAKREPDHPHKCPGGWMAKSSPPGSQRALRGRRTSLPAVLFSIPANTTIRGTCPVGVTTSQLPDSVLRTLGY